MKIKVNGLTVVIDSKDIIDKIDTDCISDKKELTAAIREIVGFDLEEKVSKIKPLSTAKIINQLVERGFEKKTKSR